MRRAAIGAGWAVERLPSWRAPEWLRDADPVLFGEPLFAAVVADSLGLALIEPTFEWLTSVPKKFVSRDIRFMTLAQARREGRAFFKPADDKCFKADVYESGRQLPGSEILPDATPVLVSEPVNWSLEIRCFVLDNEPVTMSPYLRDGKLCEAADGSWPASDDELIQATEFLSRVLADEKVEIPPAVVVDIGLISETGWGVIEANAAWGSGIYGCDPAEVLRVVRRACLRFSALSEEDSKWVLDRNT